MTNNYIFRGVEYELGLSDYHMSKDKTGLTEKLNVKNLKLSTQDFTYRVINHWERKNLMNSEREKNRGWRKYSIMDMTWLYTIKQLRNFGVNHELILKIRAFLSNDRTETSEFPQLEYYVSLALINKPVFLLIFSTGEAYPVTDGEFQINREYSSNSHHIQINLNHILQEIFPEKDLTPKFKPSFELNMDERKVIQMLRLGNFNEINLTLQEGLDEKLEEPEINIKERNIEDIIDHINNKKYKKIDLKKDMDFIISIRNEIK